MEDTHYELAVSESAHLEGDGPWLRWCARVEAALGFGLDGCQESDGYSMDDAFDHFKAGHSSRFYAERVRDTRDHMADVASQAHQDAGEAAAHMPGAWA